MQEMMPTPYEGKLRKHTLKIPSVIRKCSGIYIFGRRIRSLVFSTDLAIINNVDADAVLAVHPFTPQLRIIQGIVSTSDIPVFAGVGGGLTQGARVTQMAILAESQGAIGVVVNAPTDNASIRTLANNIELPVVVTVVNEDHDIGQRLESGAAILNVSAAKKHRSWCAPSAKSSLRFRLLQPAAPRKKRFAKPSLRAQTPLPGPRPAPQSFLLRLCRPTGKISHIRNNKSPPGT